MVGTVGTVTPLNTVPCVLAANTALIDAISLFRADISSLIAWAAALFDIVTSPNAFVMMVRSSSSPPWSVRPCVFEMIPDSNLLPAGPEVMNS